MLVSGGSGVRFDNVVILCSGVEGRHLNYVRSLPRQHPEVKWDFLSGPRGRGKPISDLQNECVRRYPESLYFKLDEDTYVSSDWDVEMEKAYQVFKDDAGLSLLTAVVTNNQRGAYHLLTIFTELGAEFTRTFNQPIVTDRMGPVWILPQCAAFMIRRFLNLEEGNRRLREANRRSEGGDQGTDENSQEPEYRTPNTETRNQYPTSRVSHPEAPSTKDHAPYLTFSYPFSINCICYDYRHWQEIGGVPEEDENGWGKWIPENRKFVVLVTDALVHHYSFFVQQNWLDRTSLLEEIRQENLPDTYQALAGWLARMRRIMQQVPGALIRRLTKK